MSSKAFADFLYGAVLRDWDAEGERMARYAKRFDAAETVRIVGAGTDLTLGLAGREGIVDKGHRNLPGGEFFFSPVESATEGEIAFLEFATEFAGHADPRHPAALRGRSRRRRLGRERRGRPSSRRSIRDEGARVLGELGIGCNEGITRYMGNTLFDEKIAGTIHLALGASYAFAGGLNESAIHWDIVKDLRGEGRIECDGEVVQEHGRWLI